MNFLSLNRLQKKKKSKLDGDDDVMIFSFTGGPTGGGCGGEYVDARFSCDRGSFAITGGK